MNLGILLWNTCNAACSHCAVSSGPHERAVMSVEQIKSLIDDAFYDDTRPRIGLSGGEAFLYFDTLCEIVEYATCRGALVSVNTNCFWATTVDGAIEKVAKLKEVGLSRLVVSTDDYHEEFIPRERVINAVKACKRRHLEVELQFVAAKNTSRLADFLAEYGEALLNVRCREIPCHPVGRAAHKVREEDLFLEEGIPTGLCPSAILSISATGNVIPCCNTAGHLPALRVGTIADPLPVLHQRFKSSALMNVLISEGPKALVAAAVEAGYKPRKDGYIDQCHLCYDLFKDPLIAACLKQTAAEILSKRLFAEFKRRYREETGNDYPELSEATAP